MQFRKLAAIGGSALMTGLSLAGAAMAATNVGNLAELATPSAGAAHFPLFVVGKDAKTSDVAGAIGVAARFAAESKTAVAATTTPQVGVVEGGINLATSGVPMYVGDPLTVARTSLTSAELPNVLKSDKFTDGSGTAYSYDQYIDLGSTSAPIFGNGANTIEPQAYVNMSSSVSSTSYMFGLRAVFGNPINISKGTTDQTETTTSSNAAAGQSLKLFGSEWSIGTDSTRTKLVLYGSGEKVTAKYQQPLEVTIAGSKHTIEFLGAETATKAQIKLDGVQDAYLEGNIYNKGSPSIAVYVKDVIQLSTTDQTQNSVVLQLGANKLVLQDGQAAKKGVNEDTVQGTSVSMTTSAGQLSRLVVYVGSADSNKAFVKKGDEHLDPVFGTVKLRFNGFAPASDSTTDRYAIKFGQANTQLTAELPEAVSGKTYSTVWAFNSTTPTAGTAIALNASTSSAYIVAEGQPIVKGDRFVIEAAGEGHLYTYDSADSTTSGATTGTPKYSFKDLFSDSTVTAAFASPTNATSTSFKIAGQTVYVKNITTAESGRSTDPTITLTWVVGQDPGWRAAPGVATELDQPWPADTSLAASSTTNSYVNIWPGIKLKSGHKVFLTKPNTTFGAGTGALGLVNNTAQRFLLPTGYLGLLYINQSGAAQNSTWLNISASDTATLGGISTTNVTASGSTTTYAIGGAASTATVLSSLGPFNVLGGQIPIQVGRVWYGLTTNTTGGAGLQLNFTLLSATAATTATATTTTIDRPALLFVSPKNDNSQYEAFWIPAQATSSGISATGTMGTSETTGVTWFSASSQATPTTSKYYNLWGDILTQDTNSQGSLAVSLSKSQAYATALMLEKTATGSSGTTGGSSFNVIKVTADVAKLDTELTDTEKKNNDLVVVGGPCVNKVAAELLKKTYPACADETKSTDAEALSKTGIPKNAAIVKVFQDAFATGKVAVLVAGWRASDTDLAALAVQQDKLAGKTDIAVQVSGTDVSTATVAAFSG